MVNVENATEATIYQRQHYIMPLGSFSEDPGECSFDKNHTELGDVQERMSRAGVDKAKEL